MITLLARRIEFEFQMSLGIPLTLKLVKHIFNTSLRRSDRFEIDYVNSKFEMI